MASLGLILLLFEYWFFLLLYHVGLTFLCIHLIHLPRQKIKVMPQSFLHVLQMPHLQNVVLNKAKLAVSAEE